MMRFWLWWWRRRPGDTDDAISLAQRLRELRDAVWAVVVRLYQYLQPRFVLVISLAAFFASVVAAWNIPVFHMIWQNDFWDVGRGEGVRNLVLAAVALIGGLIGLAGYLLLAVRTNAIQRQTELQWESQITDRFTRAVEQLGSEQIAVRLGGIYALERIAKDSERDFVTIMETLAAFVRERSPWPERETPEDQFGNIIGVISRVIQAAERTPVVDSISDHMDVSGVDVPLEETVAVPSPPIDVHVAVSVLARSIPSNSPLRFGVLEQRVDLRNANLRKLDLPGTNMAGFRFDGTRFDEANLCDASLDGCSLISAFLSSAKLRNAILIAANLSDANLDDADLSEATFGEAVLSYASVKRASGRLISFVGAQCFYTDFSDSRIPFANFSHAWLQWTNLHRAEISFSTFANAHIGDADMSDSVISGVDFGGVFGVTEGQIRSTQFGMGDPPENLPSAINLSGWQGQFDQME